jgi:hypothetical protein
MKSFVRIAIGGLLLAVPAVSMGSEITFDGSGSPTFDPHGSGTQTPMLDYFYRSFECRIGGKHVTITNNVTPPPPTVVITPPNNNPPANNPPANNPPVTPPPVITDPGNPGDPAVVPPPVLPPVIDNPTPSDPTTAAVPLPAPSEMAGAGLAVTTVLSWVRARRRARRMA